MKTVLTFLALFIFFTTSAQSNFPFPANDANWHEIIEFPTGSFPNFGYGYATFQYQYHGEKPMYGHTYGQLYSTESPVFIPNSPGNILRGYIREENNVVMLLRPDQPREDTLYNFNIQPGDTATFYRWSCTNIHPMVVNTVDSIMINNEYRRRIIFDTIVTSNMGLIEIWIEGIGSIHGPLFPSITRLQTHDVPDGSHLSCFFQNDELVYHSEDYDRCYKSTLKGDANCDEVINVLDVVIIVNNILGANPQPVCFDFADINGDGIINVLDAVLTLELILSM